MRPVGSSHLRSARDLLDYRLECTDGAAGLVRDLQLDDDNWTIRALVVTTWSWWRRRQVSVPTTRVTRLNWEHRQLGVELSLDQIRGAIDASPPLAEPPSPRCQPPTQARTLRARPPLGRQAGDPTQRPSVLHRS